MKRLFYFTVGLFFLAACSSNNQFEISGNIENGEGKEIVLSELLVSGTQEIKKIKVSEDGSFVIKSETEIPKFYHLSISKNNFLTLLVEPGENITINTKASDVSRANIIGSDGSILLQKLNNQLTETKRKLDSIKNYAESIKNQADFNLKVDEINNSYASIVAQQRDSSIAFIISNINSLASIVALYQKYDDENYVLYKNRDLQYIKIVSEALDKKYPESQHVKSLIADRENLFKKYNQLKANSDLNKLTAGAKVYNFPEIYLPNQSGDSISLNGINAKYILINFWASWNQESVQRNLELLDIYKKYHIKGFEIYQVSLDTKTENWERAINFDQLPWINVIDLNGRTSYFAKLYNVQTLPTSYLINPEGDIISINPSKDQLESTFQYALK